LSVLLFCNWLGSEVFLASRASDCFQSQLCPRGLICFCHKGLGKPFAIFGVGLLHIRGYFGLLNAGKIAVRAMSLEESQERQDSILNDLPPDDKKDRKVPSRRRIIKKAERTGAWLSVPPSTVNGTELSRQEFRDALLMLYGITPPDLPKRCDGAATRTSHCNTPYHVQERWFLYLPPR
jgi:hypothetical protein